MKQTISNITKESKTLQSFPSEVVGDIKKIFIKTPKPYHNTSLTFKTNEGEILFKTEIEQPITILYPWNFIDNQGRGVEYYSEGELFVEVEGLENDDSIEQITVFFR